MPRIGDGSSSRYVTSTHTQPAATTTSGEVLAANVNRKYALVINDSDGDVYLKIGAAAVVNQGIRLNARGGSYEMAPFFRNLSTSAINAIHAGAGNRTLLVLEGT